MDYLVEKSNNLKCKKAEINDYSRFFIVAKTLVSNFLRTIINHKKIISDFWNLYSFNCYHIWYCKHAKLTTKKLIIVFFHFSPIFLKWTEAFLHLNSTFAGWPLMTLSEQMSDGLMCIIDALVYHLQVVVQHYYLVLYRQYHLKKSSRLLKLWLWKVLP